MAEPRLIANAEQLSDGSNVKTELENSNNLSRLNGRHAVGCNRPRVELCYTLWGCSIPTLHGCEATAEATELKVLMPRVKAWVSTGAGGSKLCRPPHRTYQHQHGTTLSLDGRVQFFFPYSRKFFIQTFNTTLMAISPTTRKVIFDGGHIPTRPGLFGNSCQPSSVIFYSNTGTLSSMSMQEATILHPSGSCMVCHPRMFHLRTPL